MVMEKLKNNPNVTAVLDGFKASLKYHDTIVFQRNYELVKLSTGGRVAFSTARYINYGFEMYELHWRVRIKNGELEIRNTDTGETIAWCSSSNSDIEFNVHEGLAGDINLMRRDDLAYSWFA